jgi:ATP-dependent helicase/nuclease subunit A
MDAGQPVDLAARMRALDTHQSFLVQAPAGSGKTQLLTQRLLKLLAEVNEPEEILAITFTKAATAEMRDRVVSSLQRAHDPEYAAKDPEMARLARAALGNDAARGWHLLQQPQRLNIQTIDAVCLTIAHRTPLLSRLGGSLSPTEKAQPHYHLAARRLLSRLGEGGEISAALRSLLQLRAASLIGCEALIAGMLGKRDQWRRVMPLEEPVDWPRVRTLLETPLRQIHEEAFAKARSLFAADPALSDELIDLLQHACGNLDADEDLMLLKDVTGFEQLVSHAHWKCLVDFLITKGGTFRGRPNRTLGFLPGNDLAKNRYVEMIAEFAKHPTMLKMLHELRDLPPQAFTNDEFELLKHLLLILRYAVAELRVVFAERREVDFVELGMAARDVLTDDDGRSGELAAQVAEKWRHLLVDEFQDTSRSQYELLTLLTEGWESGERGSCLLVGDPMQSIYGFRQAEVELFEQTRKYGLGLSIGLDMGQAALPLTPIQLQTNFRSHAGLVDRLNDMFRGIFAQNADEESDDFRVAFAPSEAQDRTPRTRPGVNVWPQLLPPRATAEQMQACADAEARRVVSIIREHWPKVEAARRTDEKYQIAVLVRARSHLWNITEKLRKEDIPFRAVEIEQLGKRQEVQDLAALTRAILHPMDRIAWLSVLRAPWCGLTLKDLHTLCGQDDRSFAAQPMLTLLRERVALLSPDGQQRAQRVHAVLEDALRGKHRQVSFARWVERTWATLRGHACVDRTGYENVRAFFTLLEELGSNTATLDERLEELCAQPNPEVPESRGVQLMTIHKAKGLGFDVVIVPGMERPTQSDDQTLLRWIEQTRLVGPEEKEESSMVVAPIGPNGQQGGIYKWIGQQEKRRQDEETKRLLYVAATRAREELHLLATASMKTLKDGGFELTYGNKRSLLAVARPAVQEDFERALLAQQQEVAAPQQTELLFPAPERTIGLRRLPADWAVPVHSSVVDRAAEDDTERVERPRGSLVRRAFGTVVHALMEDLARQGEPAAVEGWRPRALALLRAAGLPRPEAEAQSAEVVRALQAVLRDPTGRWIVGARLEAQTEVAWSTWTDAGLRTLRGDRIFRAGPEPGSAGETHLWIIDYKTSRHGASGMDDFLAQEKAKYAQQLESYGEVLRKLPGNDLPVRLALYFPLVTRLVWW